MKGYRRDAMERKGGEDTVPPAASAVHRISARIVEATFAQFRECGLGRAECQVLWIGPWSDPFAVTELIHPEHLAHRGGFAVTDTWITCLFVDLADRAMGIRAQVHTHPAEAFHSTTDDTFPAVHTPGLLSLVIPDFACGPVTLERAYLARLGTDGAFHEVDPHTALEIVV